MKEEEIHKAIEGRKATKERALRQLVKAGVLTRTGAGRSHDPFLYSACASLPPNYVWEGANTNELGDATQLELGESSSSDKMRVEDV